MEIKFCGITRVEDAVAAADLSVDYIGLIFAQSPRSVTVESAHAIVRAVAGRTTPVALFRDECVGRLVEITRDLGLTTIQLHGREAARDMRRIVDALPWVRIIRAWELSQEGDAAALVSHIQEARGERVTLHRVILDAPKPAEANTAPLPFSMQADSDAEPVVSRRTAKDDFVATDDVWSQAVRALAPLGIGLWRAGGITLETVAAAVRMPGIIGIDVARGIESAPGIKDHEKMRRLIGAVRPIGGA